MTGAGNGIAAQIPSRIVRMNPKISPAGSPGAWVRRVR